MKTATVRDLRKHCKSLLRWIAVGAEVLVTQKGPPVARLLPAGPAAVPVFNWTESPEVKRDRSFDTQFSAAEAAALLAEAGGKW